MRDFTNIDKQNLKVKTRFQAFKHSHEVLSGRTSKEVVLRESNLTQFKYATESKEKKQGMKRFEYRPRRGAMQDECLFILVTKEFELNDEDILFRGGNFNFQPDLHALSDQSRLTPRNNDDKRFNDSFDEEASSQQQMELRDHMFIDLMGKSLRNSNDLQHDEEVTVKPFQKDNEEALQARFYEEDVEDEAYDRELIDDLFNSKKKLKISKMQAEKLQEQVRVSSEGYLDSSPEQLTGLKSMQGKLLRKQTIRDGSLPFSDHESEEHQLRRKSSKRKLDLSAFIEFFDPIKSKKTLSKKTMTKTKDKGSTQKH